MSSAVAQRYLDLLHLRARTPSVEALSELVSEHLSRVPFENISKLFRMRDGFIGVPEIETFLDGIEKYNFGGTCYSNNFHFYSLLVTLGYGARLCAADMKTPDVHMVVMVSVGGHEYLVDAGYAAPFLAPMPRDRNSDYVWSLGRDRYVLKPQNGAGSSRLDLYRDGQPIHGYTAKPEARRIEDFTNVIANSFRPSATFCNAVLLAKFGVDWSIVIHNLEMICSRGSESVSTRLDGRTGLLSAIEQHFGITKAVAEHALTGVEFAAGAWN